MPNHLRAKVSWGEASDPTCSPSPLLIAPLPSPQPSSQAQPTRCATGIRRPDASDTDSDSSATASGGEHPAVGGDGELVGVGARVQTQEDPSEGGSGEWFAGTLLALHASRHGTVVYDDGEEWTGPLCRIYLLQVSGGRPR